MYAVLFPEDFFNLRSHLCICKIPVFNCQVGDKVVWIMADFVYLIAVFLIFWMCGLHAVNLIIQCRFKLCISIFCRINIFILAGIGGRNNCGTAALNAGAAAAE